MQVGEDRIQCITRFKDGSLKSIESFRITDSLSEIKDGTFLSLDSSHDTLEKLYYNNGRIYGNNYYYEDNVIRTYIGVCEKTDGSDNLDTLWQRSYDKDGNLIKESGSYHFHTFASNRESMRNDSVFWVLKFNPMPPGTYLGIETFLIDKSREDVMITPVDKEYRSDNFWVIYYFDIDTTRTYDLVTKYKFLDSGSADTIETATKQDDILK